MNKLAKTDLLILDDFGLHGFDTFARNTLLDLVDERGGKTSLIIASQLPVTNWYPLIGDNTLADAILDRIVNNSHRIELKGESLRKNQVPIE
jgi:DNA replication protein DnaC